MEELGQAINLAMKKFKEKYGEDASTDTTQIKNNRIVLEV